MGLLMVWIVVAVNNWFYGLSLVSTKLEGIKK